VAATTGPTASASVVATPGSCSTAIAHGPDRQEPGPGSASACWLPTGFQDMSPSIQVSRNGTLFVARSLGGVLRSQDHGAHWSYLPVPDLPDGDSHAGTPTTHGYVHLDPRTDRLYYVTSLGVKSCGGLAGSVLSWSDDLGATWNGTTVSCDTYDWGKVVTAPAPAGSAYPSVIYFFGVGKRPVGGQRFVYRSTDGGNTFTKLDKIASATTEAGVGAAGPDGTVYFDYPEVVLFDPDRLTDQTYPFVPGNLCRQMIAVSTDQGETWAQEPVPGSKACLELYGQQRVAVDSAGTVYTVWVDDDTSQLLMSHSTDRARTWSKPVDVTAPGMTYSLTIGNIIATSPGHVVIAGMETQGTEKPGLADANAPVHAVLTETDDATAVAPRFQSVDLDSGGDPTMADGEANDEANAYLGASPTGDVWAVYSRHTPSFGQPGQIAAAHFLP
jgi:hypothetical protein